MEGSGSRSICPVCCQGIQDRAESSPPALPLGPAQFQAEPSSSQLVNRLRSVHRAMGVSCLRVPLQKSWFFPLQSVDQE